jgi:hypothetical protein
VEHFICEIIKPIKRRSIKAALNKNKSMNKVLSVHTTAEQCLYQFLRDGKCYNGQDPNACKEFKQRIEGIDLEQITAELKGRLRDSILLKYRQHAEQNKVPVVSDTQEADDAELQLSMVASGGDRVNEEAPKSLCTECGAWVQYPHDPKTLQVTCWLCVAKEVFECANEKQETPDTKPKESKPNGKRSSIPKRRQAGGRNSRA